MADMEALTKQFKAEHPFYFGKINDAVVLRYFGTKSKVSDAFKSGVENVGGVVDAGAGVVSSVFDITVWLKDNWQIAIIGAVALLVILRD